VLVACFFVGACSPSNPAGDTTDESRAGGRRSFRPESKKEKDRGRKKKKTKANPFHPKSSANRDTSEFILSYLDERDKHDPASLTGSVSRGGRSIHDYHEGPHRRVEQYIMMHIYVYTYV